MSVENRSEPESRAQAGSCDAIELMIYPKEHDLGGFSVRRALPNGHKRMIGPWVFFDHMGPATFAAGEGIDVRPHPHINLATVTYLFEGEMLHRDSLGNEMVILPGEINLMVAGRGIVHSERQRAEVKAKPHVLEGLQLWLALPEQDEEMAPEFHHYSSESIPQVEVDSVFMRVLIGTAYGVQSPVKTFARTLYIEARMKAGQRLVLPSDIDELGLYVLEGELMAKTDVINQYAMAVLRTGHDIEVRAVRDTQLAIIGGERLPARHIWWNFVSSRQERIEQAKQDWTSGVFPKIPGDAVEFIPLPE
ncbi:MAG: hypothetical protein GC149_02025 [Gammaproteobacteria bacterium]|nr:hypothetical protein [Gammaproteobacteria bacterium]